MARVFTESAALAHALMGDLGRGVRVIGVDGAPAAGKSTLASDLSERLQIPALHLDDFLHKEMGGFAEHLRYAELDARISRVETAVLIDGVCLLDVTARMRVDVDVLVYVMRIGHIHGLWQDENDLGAPATGATEWSQERAAGYDQGLWPEVIRYHGRYRPHAGAKYEFHRIESPQSDS